MGLFGSKKKTYTTTSYSRLIEDKDVKDDFNVAVLSYVLNSDTRVDGLADSLMDTYRKQVQKSITGTLLGVNRWANNKYYYGVPKAKTFIQQDVDLITEARNFLDETLNVTADVSYAKFGPINQNHATYDILQSKYGFDIESNEATTETKLNGSTTYLQDFVITYCQPTIDNVINPDYLNPMGYPATSGQTKERKTNRDTKHTSWQVDTNATYDYALVTFVYWDSNNKPIYYTKKINYLGFEDSGNNSLGEIGDGTSSSSSSRDATIEHDYFMFRYTANNKTYVFTYRFGLGTYPKLDNLFSGDVDLGTYAPNLMFRLNGSKITSDNEAHKTCKVYATRLGLTYDDLNDQVHKNISNINDVSEIFLTFRLPVNTKDKYIQDYMFNFFMEAYKSMKDERATSDYTDLNREYIKGFAKQGISIQISDKAISYGISCNSIWYADTVGSIGEVGTVTSSFENVKANGSKNKRSITSVIAKIPVHTFKKQITKSVYRTIKVYGAVSTQSISNSYTSTATGDDENLMIPVDIDVIRRRYPKHKTQLLCKSMYLTVNTVKVVKKKWYQTGIFKVIMFIVAVVIAYVTAGTGIVWYLAIMQAVAYAVAINVAVTIASQILYKVFGVDAAIVTAVIAIVAMALGAYAVATKTVVNGISATGYMAAMSASFNISNNLIAMNTESKIKAYKEFKADMDATMESIDTLRDQLGLNVAKIDVYDLLANPITAPDIRLGETPRSFYERTLYTQPFYIPILLTHSYVYQNTQLPTFQDIQAKWSNTDG
jgi:hypothetical protein